MTYVNINLGGLVIAVEDPALACACEHDSCFAQQNSSAHHNECDCPKVEGQVALSVADIHDNSWDNVHWAYATKEDVLEALNDLHSQLLTADQE